MKVLWGLGELGLPFERIDVGGAFGKTDTPEYRAMNPTGLVPTLQEGTSPCGRATRSCAISAQAHASGSALWPADAAGAGQHRSLDGCAADGAQPADERGCSGVWSAPRRRSGT